MLIYQPKINWDIHNRFLSKPESNQKQKPLVNAQKIRKRGSKKIISSQQEKGRNKQRRTTKATRKQVIKWQISA